jgi:uncharacterized protein (TIGR01244 family)
VDPGRYEPPSDALLPAPSAGIRALAALLLAVGAGCIGATPRDETTDSGYRAIRAGKVAIGGQPSAEQLAELRSRGYRTVISFRDAVETPWDEGAAATRAGLRFARVPAGEGAIAVDLLARTRVLIDDSDGPVLLHCAAGDRAALIWGMLEAGERPDAEILATAGRAGLLPEQRTRLEEYLHAHAARETRLR